MINTPKGSFLWAYLNRNSDKYPAALDGTKPKISIQLAHDILGHRYEELTRLAAKGLG